MPPSRRDFIGTSTALGLAATLPPSLLTDQQGKPPATLLFRAPPMERVRIGFVGVGGQGTSHIENLATIEGADVRAVCDIEIEHATGARDKLLKAGRPAPRLFTSGPTDFRRMCDEMELDLVYTATPWEWHVPVMLYAMQSGKHAATEVPAALTHDDCWRLVAAAEKYRKHCIMMENCCYDRREMLTLNLARRGILGDLVHAECGYLHDLREVKFEDKSEGLWRRAYSRTHDGNLYPTHGIGPIAQCLNINRGNRFELLTSQSSRSLGLHAYAESTFAADDPKRAERFVMGDVNVSLIRTVQGQTITLTHNTNNARPYSRVNLLQGTKGLIQGWPDRIYVEGMSKKKDEWDTLDDWYAKYEHPLWTKDEVKHAKVGHGGMDWLEDWRLIQCLRAGEPTDLNVYDAASWSALIESSVRSVADGSRPEKIPDFTRGLWKVTPPLGIISPS